MSEKPTAPRYKAVGSAERDDIEDAIEDAKSTAAGCGASVHVVSVETNEILATAWPDWRVDLTFAGSRLA